MRLKLRKLQGKDILLALIIFLCTMPNGLKVFIPTSVYYFLNSYACILVFGLIFAVVGLNKMHLKNYRGTIIIGLFRLFMLVNSCIRRQNDAAISENIRYFLIITAVCFVCEYYIQKNMLKDFFRIICNLYVLYLIFNTIFLIMYPEGMTTVKIFTTNGLSFRTIGYHFIGFRNYFGFYFLPVLAFAFFDNYYWRRKHIVLQGLIIVNTFLAKSSTSIIAVTLFYIVILCGKQFIKIRKSKKRFLFDTTTVLGAYVILFVLIIILDSGIALRQFIANIFGKMVSFTGRTEMWRIAISKILEKPILGYGNDDVVFANGYYWYAHNGVLDLLVQGGLLLFLFYCYILYICYKEIKEVKEHNLNRIIIAITTMYCVLMMTESIINYSILFYCVLCICMNISVIEKNKQGIIRQ